MDRATSLRILGLPRSASDDEVRAAYWTLRAHVEARALASATPEQRQSRDGELHSLEAMLAVLEPERAGWRDSGMAVWASLATVLALVLAVRLLAGAGDGPPVLVEGDGNEPGAAAGAGAPAADRARLIANAKVAGAGLEIEEVGAEGVVAAGPADETVYWLVPGEYALRVRHPDCDDAWEQSLTAAAHGDYLLEPRVCSETAWLVVHANVERAQVSIDGREVGPAGPGRYPMHPGEREVRVDKRGYVPWRGIALLEPGKELTLKPRLEPEPTDDDGEAPAPAAAAAPIVTAAASPPDGYDGEDADAQAELASGWHHDTRQWVLARFDTDRSGAIDRAEELGAIPCDYWKGIERSYDTSRLGIPLARIYGFDGEGWKPGSLGVDSEIRDLAFRRLRDCGLRY